jgi:hypothetical protein
LADLALLNSGNTLYKTTKQQLYYGFCHKKVLILR